MRRRIVGLLSITLLIAGVGAPSALAAAPGNDNLANATAIAALPFSDVVDTTEATVEATDPSTNCFDPENTVWYTFTPGGDGFVAADTFGSDFDTTLAVFTGSPGSFNEVRCNDDSASDLQSRVVWDAQAGTTYSIMAGTCCGGGSSGGSLHLNLDNTGPLFTLDALIVDARGQVKAKTGVATISGTIECSNGPGQVFLEVDLRQRIGRSIARGFGFDSVECDGSQAWTITVTGDSGLFVAGRATAEVFADSEDDFLFTEATVRLRGK